MKESEIRPASLHEKYLELSLQDAGEMDPATFVAIACPGCASLRNHPQFVKNRFTYALCDGCGTLFCSPRPSPETLDKFYASGRSSDYWATTFFPAVAEPRREKLFRPKAKRVSELLNEHHLPETICICDVGAGYGIFLEELSAILPHATVSAIEPGASLARECRQKGFETLECSAEQALDWEGRFDLVISSEVIEHVFAPEKFVRSLWNLLRPGGMAIVTGLGYEGFDILTLQKESKSVFPPHHLNFMSVDGFKTLFRRVGFASAEVRTPGQLDVDIVLNSGLAPEFLKVMAKREGALQEFQSLLARHALSSHVWVIGRKG